MSSGRLFGKKGAPDFRPILNKESDGLSFRIRISPRGSTKRAVSFIELIAVLAIIAIIATGTISFFGARIRIAKGKQTVENLSRVAEKAIQFYYANNAWPADVNALVLAGYLPNGFNLNVFGQAYAIAGIGIGADVRGVVVATQVRRGSVNTGMNPNLTVAAVDATWDRVGLFRGMSLGGSESSAFDARYLD